MKNVHQCSNCGSAQIVCFDADHTYGYEVPVPDLSGPKLVRHMCRRCGYMEESISLPDYIEELIAKYHHEDAARPALTLPQ
jgi:predicted nucleic-acid-binding Zn-ribbon protein